MAFAPLVFGIAFTVYALWDKKGEPVLAMGEPPRQIAPFLAVASTVAPLVLVLLYWFDLLAIARRTLRRPLPRLRVAVLVPLLWIVGGGLALVGLPAVAYFVAVVFYSLRGSGLGG